MLNTNILKPLPQLDFDRLAARGQKLRDEDIEYLRYYRIHFAKELGIRQYLGNLPLAGFQIATQYFLKDKRKPTVLLIHGYFDHVGLYHHLIRALLNNGFNVLAFDLPGHGLSSGEPAAIGSFADYQAVLKALLNKLPKSIKKDLSLVAQSTGCSIATDYVLNNEHCFKKICMFSPLVVPKNWQFIKLRLLLIGSFVSRVPRRFLINSGNAQFLTFLKYHDGLQCRSVKVSWLKALAQWEPHFLASPKSQLPCLIIQGDDDATVDWRYNCKRLSEKFLLSNILLLPKAGHHMVSELEYLRSKAFAAAIGFLKT